MMQSHPDATAYPDAHKLVSKGVVPGYAGHVPRARDTFGSTSVGGLAPEPHVGAHKKMGAMAGHAEPVPWEKDYDWETQVYNGFSGTKNGVIPGYAGFRPGARDVDGVAAFGGIPHDGPSGHGDNPKLKSDWDQGRMKPDTDYRQVVHGIVPGYTGHVPNAIDKHGTTYFGKITKDGDQRTITKDQLYVEDGADSGDACATPTQANGAGCGPTEATAYALRVRSDCCTFRMLHASQRHALWRAARAYQLSARQVQRRDDEPQEWLLWPHARLPRRLRHDRVQPALIGEHYLWLRLRK